MPIWFRDPGWVKSREPDPQHWIFHKATVNYGTGRYVSVFTGRYRTVRVRYLPSLRPVKVTDWEKVLFFQPVVTCSVLYRCWIWIWIRIGIKCWIRIWTVLRKFLFWTSHIPLKLNAGGRIFHKATVRFNSRYLPISGLWLGRIIFEIRHRGTLVPDVSSCTITVPLVSLCSTCQREKV